MLQFEKQAHSMMVHDYIYTYNCPRLVRGIRMVEVSLDAAATSDPMK